MRILHLINKKVGVKLLLWITFVLIVGFSLIGYITYSREQATLIANLNTKIELQSNNISELTTMYLQNKQQIYNTLYKQFTDKLQQKVNVQYNIVLINYVKYKNWLKQHPDVTNEVKQAVLKKYQSDQLEQITDLNNQDKQHYVFVFTTKGVMICHIEPKLIGVNVIDLQDKKGRYLIKDMIDLQENKGSGLYSYYWQNGNEKPHLKTSFVKYFKDWNWVLGTGEYETEVQQNINENLDKLFSNYVQQVNNVKISEDSYPVVLEKKGDKFYFYVYIKPELIGKQVPDYGQKGNPLQKGIIGESGVIHYYWDNGGIYQKTLWYKHIPNSDIYITYAVYDKDTYAPLHKALINTIFIFISILIGTIAIIFIVVKFNITDILKPLPNFFHKFQNGDLSEKLAVVHEDEIASVVKQINKAIDGLGITVIGIQNRAKQLVEEQHKIIEASDTLSNTVEAVNISTDELSNSIENMSSNVEEVNASVEEFQTTINNLADTINTIDGNQGNIQTALKSNDTLSDKTIQQLTELDKDSKLTKDTVAEMNEKISQITEFSTLIAKIAEQTNLLSLNAAIEAARAGESGQGFQVIADEIRVLANDSKETQEKISDAIAEIVDMSNTTETTVDTTISKIQETTSFVKDFIAASKDISNKVNDIILSINDVSSNVEESNATIEEISTQVNNVQELVVDANSKITSIAEQAKEQVSAMSNLEDVVDDLKHIIKGFNIIVDSFKINEEDQKIWTETLQQRYINQSNKQSTEE